jgi:RNA polymerase sigma factor (sigma-70 family)
MLQDTDQRSQAIESLIQLYWMPVYKYLRMKWMKSEEDAKDLTQAFFLRVVEKNFLADYKPEKARFRTYLRTCLDGFSANELKSQKALKRGGETVQIHLDFQIAENELIQLQNLETPERIFEKEWVRSVFRVSLETFSSECKAKGKETHYRLFERYDMDSDEKMSYKDLAEEFGLPVTQVTNYLADARKQFRRIVLETLRASTASEEEFRKEVRSLLGLDIE